MTLSSEQKARIDELYEENQDLIWITQQLFEDDSLKGVHKEGRAVKSYLVTKGKKYNTTKSEAKCEFELNSTQKELLMSDQISSAMSPIEITRLVYQDPDIKPLSGQHRLVISFLEKFRTDVVDQGQSFSGSDWYAPKSIPMTVRRVNKWCDISLKEDVKELSTKHKRYMEKLLEYLNIFKLKQTLNSFKTTSDRELFESEFIRATWDKPDLTVDEINLYMMICSNYVRAGHIQKRLDQFNLMLESEDLESGEISMRLTEHVKATNDELNACEKRIESLTHKLNGSRAERLKNKTKNAGNILDLVANFQEHERRTMMLDMADMRLKLVDEEAARLESLDEFKARVFGISKEELL
jgi:hypothetical protein